MAKRRIRYAVGYAPRDIQYDLSCFKLWILAFWRWLEGEFVRVLEEAMRRWPAKSQLRNSVAEFLWMLVVDIPTVRAGFINQLIESRTWICWRWFFFWILRWINPNAEMFGSCGHSKSGRIVPVPMKVDDSSVEDCNFSSSTRAVMQTRSTTASPGLARSGSQWHRPGREKSSQLHGACLGDGIDVRVVAIAWCIKWYQML